MSGILDNKSRIIDAIVTPEGRRQIASGDLRVRYATFTDVSSFYEVDAVSGSSDPSTRVYFEASSLPQDQIVFEADDAGLLMPFGSESRFVLRSGQLIDRTLTAGTSTIVTGSNWNLTMLSGSQFASTIEGILTGSIDNFSKLRVIGSHDKLVEDDDFAIGPSTVQFTLTDERPLVNDLSTKVNVNDLDSLFSDPRLGNVHNFQYLPPINRQPLNSTDNSGIKDTIGDYQPWGSTSALTPQVAYSALRSELSEFERTGFCKTISFDPTSRENTLVGQVFELSDRQVTKLDVIHYGQFVNAGNVADVFFVGKVIVDDNDTQSFIHLFTLMFE